MTPSSTRTAARISILYVVAASAWILVSDRVAMLWWEDTGGLTAVQTYKGWVFVGATGLVLFGWIRRAMTRAAGAAAVLERVEAEKRSSLEVAEHARRESQTMMQRWSMMLEGSTDSVVLVDREWRYLHLNRQAETMLGRPAPAVLGKVMWDVFPEVVGSVFHQHAMRVTNEGTAAEFEIYFEAWDRWFHNKLYPTPEGIAIFTSEITARKQAEARLKKATQLLRESEARLNAAQARAKVGSWEANTLTGESWWSQQMCRLFGRDPAQGAAPLEEFLERIHPEDRAGVVATAATMRDLRTTKMETFRSNPADGPVRYFDAIVECIRDEEGRPTKAGGTILDVTDQRLAERALSESELKYRRIVETAEEGIWMFDTENRTRFVNGKLASMLGTTIEGMAGRAIGDFMDAEWREEAERSHERCRRGERTTQDFKFTREDGTEIWTSISTAPIFDVSGAYDGALVMVTDVTERKRLEEQLRQAQKMEAIGQLSGGVAHDFNNLLTVIKGQISLLQIDGPRDPETDHALADIAVAADRATALTRQLLAFSRKQVLQLRDMDLNRVVEGMGSMVRRIVGEDIELTLVCAPGPLGVQADTGMMEQVILNLVVNARDAMPGGGELRLETAAVSVNEAMARRKPGAKAGEFVRLSVSDTGCGIPAETAKRVFEPFFTTKEFGKGTGLGLATVYGIVQQHRGWIVFETEPGRGTRFDVYLPRLAELRASEEAPVVRRPQEKPAKEGGGETILLVEDEEAVRMMVRATLMREGYTVIEAATGAEALAMWQTHRARVNLLFTDMVMPEGISGVELAQRLVADKPGLRVICTSGYSPEIAGKNFPLQEGVNFLPKPFDVATLARAVRAALDGKGTATPWKGGGE